MWKSIRQLVLASCAIVAWPLYGQAQTIGSATVGQAPADQAAPMQMPAASSWQFMQDGVVFLEFNHQGGPRGGNEVVAPNWWMGMASRETSRGTLTLTGMLNLEPATIGKAGYREIFQAGEALDGRPLIDRQHPHDMFMQLAAVWRMPVSATTGFTIAGGPAAEPALGPVAFMHRASAADNPTAPLSHHTFDSTHVAFGVVTAAVDHGPLVVEASIFNGREPDENRWNFDFGKLDSYSARLWYRPNDEWEFQASSGHLTNPEELEPGDVTRSTASAMWTRKNGSAISSITVGVGRNLADHGTRNAFFAEGARHANGTTVYGRFEAVQVEAALFQTDTLTDTHTDHPDAVLAATIGAAKNVLEWRGLEGGIGGDLTLYGVPSPLQPMYTSNPVSAHVYFRVRPPAGAMGRMWNMRMSQPMASHNMPMRMPRPTP